MRCEHDPADHVCPWSRWTKAGPAVGGSGSAEEARHGYLRGALARIAIGRASREPSIGPT